MKFKILILILLLTLGLLPTFAQESTTNTVTFSGVSFSFESSIATNVTIVQYPGDPIELGPGAAEPAYTDLSLFNQEWVAPQSIITDAGRVRVYDVADFAGYTEHEARLARLQTLLADRPDLSSESLPFIPVPADGQAIRAHADYVDTDSVSEISYLTAFSAALEPLMNNSLVYTFQGLSADGTKYISVMIYLTTDLLPSELGPDYDPAAFYDNSEQYFADTVAMLNDAAPSDFTPSLDTLDALVSSISFGA